MTEQTRWRRGAILVAKLALVALVLWGLRGALGPGLAELAQGTRDLHYGWLAASAGLFLAGMLPPALFWRRVLADLDQRPPLLDVLRAYVVGHLGKYVPGKALVLVIRTALLPKTPGGTTVVAASIFYETLTSMAVGAALGAGIVAVAYREHAGLAALAAMMVLALAVPTVPPVFVRLSLLVGMHRWDPSALKRLARLRYQTLASGWLTLPLSWIAAGLALYACLRALGHDVDMPRQLAALTAGMALASVAGFASFLPAGAVVREYVLYELLARQLGLSPADAVATAVLLRLVNVLAEAVVSTILYFLPFVLPTRRPP